MNSPSSRLDPGRPAAARRAPPSSTGRLDPGGDREHAAGGAAPDRPPPWAGRANPGQAGVPQPRLQQEGPSRPRDRPPGAGRRPAPTRPGRRRSDQRQHRDRPGDRLRGARSSVRGGHVEGEYGRAGAADGRVRGRGRPGRSGAGGRAGPGLRPRHGPGGGASPAARRGTRRLPCLPVRVRGQLPRPRTLHRPRALGASARPDRRLRHDRRDLRHLHRGHASPSASETLGPRLPDRAGPGGGAGRGLRRRPAAQDSGGRLRPARFAAAGPHARRRITSRSTIRRRRT